MLGGGLMGGREAEGGKAGARELWLGGDEEGIKWRGKSESSMIHRVVRHLDWDPKCM